MEKEILAENNEAGDVSGGIVRIPGGPATKRCSNYSRVEGTLAPAVCGNCVHHRTGDGMCLPA
ncbi:MAG: hypothetical protein LBL98_06325 [Ruminococcus sp.]|jgi:hypothetical protein|nr:hypothetical protein [Ruminococcus sp.]